MGSVANQHEKRWVKQALLLDILNQRLVIVGLAVVKDPGRPIRDTSMVDNNVVQVILIAVNRGPLVEQANVTLSCQRAHSP